MKVVCGLGNPGPRYESTRHNVGWWAVDRLAVAWGFGAFHRDAAALVAGGGMGGEVVRLVKPLTYMNRSGWALAPLLRWADFQLERDLLVVVDDAALPVGRLRFRAHGSAGGHNGLKSVQAVLGSSRYARLRIGVGTPPPAADLADYVLSPFPPEEEEVVLDRLEAVPAAVRLWIEAGIHAAMNRYNR